MKTLSGKSKVPTAICLLTFKHLYICCLVFQCLVLCAYTKWTWFWYLFVYRITTFRNTEVDKWQRKIQVTTGAAALKGKLHAFNQNISDQVAGYMRDPSRMINRMYLTKSTVGVFGEDAGEPGAVEEVWAFVLLLFFQIPVSPSNYWNFTVCSSLKLISSNWDEHSFFFRDT